MFCCCLKTVDRSVKCSHKVVKTVRYYSCRDMWCTPRYKNISPIQLHIHTNTNILHLVMIPEVVGQLCNFGTFLTTWPHHLRTEFPFTTLCSCSLPSYILPEPTGAQHSNQATIHTCTHTDPHWESTTDPTVGNVWCICLWLYWRTGTPGRLQPTGQVESEDPQDYELSSPPSHQAPSASSLWSEGPLGARGPWTWWHSTAYSLCPAAALFHSLK